MKIALIEAAGNVDSRIAAEPSCRDRRDASLARSPSGNDLQQGLPGPLTDIAHQMRLAVVLGGDAASLSARLRTLGGRERPKHGRSGFTIGN
ncbi:hypothetical protein [Sphingosinicella sp. CPCC 101087]|uniref:hypothetical protein n=1 Tax=Sphingosinicella sp. CPCC 101087 TaxID=2497754 RepID=UPI00101C9B9D|nr:hypothetical protein [Sphingosinicella sp. CPCC 101087]